MLDEYKRMGRLPEESPVLTDGGLAVYAEGADREALRTVRGLPEALSMHLSRSVIGDYFAVTAYLPRTDRIHAALQDIRQLVRARSRIATTLGYGPRFLHSTGQLHKGGPNSGLFLQLTADDPDDLAIPGEPFTFGILKSAQARGDFASLSARGRRAIRIHLGGDITGGLERIRAAVERAI